MSEDYYKILSVEPTASEKGIQKAADRLISNLIKKRGLSNTKRSEILSQIRKAREVLTDPPQRYEYDVKQGFKRDFSGQASVKQSNYIPLSYSESIEAIDTVKVPGRFDYEKMENSIAAMEIEKLYEAKDISDAKTHSEIISLKNIRPVKLADEFFINIGRSEADITIISEYGRFKEISSNLKQDFTTDDFKTSGKDLAMPHDTYKGQEERKTIYKNDQLKEYSSDLNQEFTEGNLKTSGKDSSMPQDTYKGQEERQTINKNDQLKENSSDLKEEFTEGDLKTSGKDPAVPQDTDMGQEEKQTINKNDQLKEYSSDLNQEFTEGNLKTSGKDSSMPQDTYKGQEEKQTINKNDQLKENSSDLKQVFTEGDLKTSGKDPAVPQDTDMGQEEKQTINKNDQLKENSSDFKQVFTEGDLKTSGKDPAVPQDTYKGQEENQTININDQLKENSSDLKQVFTEGDLKTSGKDPAISHHIGNGKTEKKTFNEIGKFNKKSLNLKEDATTGVLKTSGNDTVIPIYADTRKKERKTTAKNWKDVLSGTELSVEPVKIVSAKKRIAGTDVKTDYSFGSDIDFIDVFVNGELRVKIVDGESHDVYCSEIKRDDLPPGVVVCVSTVISANNCIITTEVIRRGKRESIAVYKNDILLCKTGSTILE